MNNKEMSEEFIFIRDKLQRIAKHIVDNEFIEATFTIGCLHSICHQHAENLKTKHPEKEENWDRMKRTMKGEE